MKVLPSKDIVKRSDNLDFLDEMKRIYYQKEDSKGREQRPLQQKVQPHGMPLINFTLTEQLIEDRIQEAAKQQVTKTQKKMEQKLDKKTTDLRRYMDH